MHTTSHNPSSKPPRISVLMPVYNCDRYLHEAIDDILAQNETNFELICVDDGSTDGSLDVLRDYAKRDDRVIVVTRPNTGICGALNDALAAARAPVCARMDGDDRCPPHRFATQLAYLDNHPRCVAVGSWVTRIDPTGSPAGDQQPPTDHTTIDAALMQGDGSAVIHATMLIRTDVLRDVGGYRERFNWVEDIDLCLHLAERGQLANLPEHLYSYRRHPTSVCATRANQMRQTLQQVIDEACERRGIEQHVDLLALRPELGQPAESVATMYRHWACHAVHQGNGRLARRHAMSALVREPWAKANWQTLYWALAA